MADVYGTFVTDNSSGISIDTSGFFPRLSIYNPKQQGVFALNPLATPKYAKNNGRPRDAEYKDTLARLYISLPSSGNASNDAALFKEYRKSLPDAETQALADVLVAGPNGGTGFIDFFLTQANESFQEVMQVDKVLADDYVAFFYGQAPPVFQYTGVLLNSLQDDQRSGFARAYASLLRGTQLARRGALARLRYDSVIVSGVMTAHTQQLNADNEMAVPFSFSFLVKDYTIVKGAQFSKVDKSQYVQLISDAAITSLAPIRAASDTRINLSTVLPPIQNDTPAASPSTVVTPVNTGSNSMQQTTKYVQDPLVANFPAANVYGTIDHNPPTPPAGP